MEIPPECNQYPHWFIPRRIYVIGLLIYTVSQILRFDCAALGKHHFLCIPYVSRFLGRAAGINFATQHSCEYFQAASYYLFCHIEARSKMKHFAFVLLWFQHVYCHVEITYPGWRGNNLKTNGSIEDTHGLGTGITSTGEVYPYGMQWIYPCE